MREPISLRPPDLAGSPALRPSRGSDHVPPCPSVAPLGNLADILLVEDMSCGSCRTSHHLKAQEYAVRMAMHLSAEIDATIEQQDKLVAIAKSATNDLLRLREQLVAGRNQGLEILRQPTIDRAAIAKLSAEQMAHAERASWRLVEALAAAAKVLTPVQRTMYVAAQTDAARNCRRWSRNG